MLQLNQSSKKNVEITNEKKAKLVLSFHMLRLIDAQEKHFRHKGSLKGEWGCLMTSKRRDWHSYRRDDEEFAAHEVEKAHGASAVGIGEQCAVMAPCHPSPLGVWVLWHCGRWKKNK